MENKGVAAALNPSTAPYTSSLARQYGIASNYFAVSHPSLPNYLALTSGSTWGITDDGYRPLPAGGIGDQLSAANVPWRAYMEDMAPGGCLHATGEYAVKHNPFAYYGGGCPANVVPLDQLDSDLGGVTPRFVWITPNLCHDTHDCPVASGDAWLATQVPRILASAAWKQGGVLLITWDEDDGGDNHVATLVIAPAMSRHTSDQRYDHYSLLATIDDRFALQRLGAAAQAASMTEFFG
jgi:phospholipase C